MGVRLWTKLKNNLGIDFYQDAQLNLDHFKNISRHDRHMTLTLSGKNGTDNNGRLYNYR
jgi:hypothetical protein